MSEIKFHTYNDGRLIKKSFYKTLPFLILTSLLDLVLIKTDQIICGNFLGSEAVAAISYLSVIEITMNAICVSVNQGVLICLSKILGKNNSRKTNSIFANIILTCLILSVVEVLIMIPMINITAYSYPISDTLRQMIFEYSIGLIFSTIFVLFSSTNVCVLVAYGRSHKCMIISLIGAIANVFFDIFFIVLLNLGIMGASFGSASAMLLCIITEIILLRDIVDISAVRKCKTSLKNVWHIISTGLPFSVNSIMCAITTFFLYQVITILCTSDTVTVYTAAKFTDAFTTCAVIGITKSFISLFGVLYEAGDANGAKKFFVYVLKVTCISSIAICLVVLIFPQINLIIYGLTEHTETDLLIIRLIALAIPFESLQSLFCNLLVYFSYKKNTYYIYIVCFFIQLILLLVAFFFKIQLLIYLFYLIKCLVAFFMSLMYMKKIKNVFYVNNEDSLFVLSAATKNSTNVLEKIQKISEYLENKSVDAHTANHIALVLEEVMVYTMPKNSTKIFNILIIITHNNNKTDITVINDIPQTNILLDKKKIDNSFDNIQFLDKISKNIEQSYLVDLNYYTITINKVKSICPS